MSEPDPQPSARAPELERTAVFRTLLRRFLHRTKADATAAGLTPERYDLLLMVKAAANRSSPATVGSLCASLDLRQTAVTELVNRAEEAGLVARTRSHDDGRVSLVSLTAEGEAKLRRVFDELASDRAELVESFRLLNESFQA